jgi:transposase
MERPAYPTDVSDDAWAFGAPSLPLMTEDAPQRDHSRREVLHGRGGIGRAGAAWRLRPHALPPGPTVDQHRQRGLPAGVCATIVQALCDSRPLPAPCASGTRAGDAGAQRRRGAQVYMAGESLGPLVAAPVTAATEPDRPPGSL